MYANTVSNGRGVRLGKNLCSIIMIWPNIESSFEAENAISICTAMQSYKRIKQKFGDKLLGCRVVS